MTHKDYVVVARAVRAAYAKRLTNEDVAVVAQCLAAELAKDNPRFDALKFRNACGEIL